MKVQGVFYFNNCAIVMMIINRSTVAALYKCFDIVLHTQYTGCVWAVIEWDSHQAKYPLMIVGKTTQLTDKLLWCKMGPCKISAPKVKYNKMNHVYEYTWLNMHPLRLSYWKYGRQRKLHLKRSKFNLRFIKNKNINTQAAVYLLKQPIRPANPRTVSLFAVCELDWDH